MRRVAKAVNFGVIYGQSPFGLAKMLEIDKLQAAQFISAYFAGYPGVSRFLETILTDCRRNGYVTTILGRRRTISGIRGAGEGSGARGQGPEENPSPLTGEGGEQSEPGEGEAPSVDRPTVDADEIAPAAGIAEILVPQRNLAERTAINTVVQGSAADLIKLAMIAIHRRLRHESRATRMLLQIHDELVFEVPPDEMEEMVRLVREEMSGVMQLSVPLKVDVKTGANWADCEPWS